MLTPLRVLAESLDPTPTERDRPLTEAEWMVLGRWLEQYEIAEIAAELEISVERVRGTLLRPAVKAASERLDRRFAEKVTRGTFGVAAIFKSNAPHAAKNIVRMANLEEHAPTRLKANLEVLRHAGAEPAKRVELVTPDQLIDQMTVEELENFALYKVFPERLRGQAAQLVKALPDRTQRAIIDAEWSEEDAEEIDEEDDG